jgi:hypothetical protein
MTYKTPNAQRRDYFIWADMGLGSSLFFGSFTSVG